MNEVLTWEDWIAFIEPYYPDGKHGLKPQGIEKMLRMHLLQCWFNLFDDGIEDAIYDSYAFRSFLGINFFEEQTLDATTLLKSKYMLEENKIAEKLFNAINFALKKCGYMMRDGMIVDATIIQSPSSPKDIRK